MKSHALVNGVIATVATACVLAVGSGIDVAAAQEARPAGAAAAPDATPAAAADEASDIARKAEIMNGQRWRTSSGGARVGTSACPT